MGHLTTAEDHRDDDLIFMFEKRSGLSHLELDVMLARLGPQPNLFDLGLMDVSLVMLPFLLVFELAEIHDSADGRLLIRSHLHQVETAISGDAESLVGGEDSQLASVCSDHSNRSDTDLIVDAMLFLDGLRLRPRTLSRRPVGSRLLHTSDRRNS